MSGFRACCSLEIGMPLFTMTTMHSGTSGIKRANLIHENIDCIVI